ncbi:Fanconi anemia group M protein [Fasciola gigantica]|uniref:Fanconi anemia group M protein n=1 Tax=Fasciola gigantica TaxID=46835 RepID=A0A504Z185_FASGI|nr:Fanconi anemia group M protein [Fasciola gigantica]
MFNSVARSLVRFPNFLRFSFFSIHSVRRLNGIPSMKQTSLIQSWTRAFKLTSSRQQGAISDNCHVEPRDDHVPKSNNACDSNFDDRVLTDVLDDFDKTNAVNIYSNTPIRSPGDIDPAILERVQQRKPIAYRPTANDSDQLNDFNLDAGRVWIYPTNVAFRDYQFHITEQCLYKNTLVCLPTGLGKTFIAAVVIHNFLRWYPTGKSVFMAPTRPLVAQQLAACRQLIGSTADSVVELTGSIAQSKRRELWSRLRVFFLTPQILANDLEADVCPATDLRLLVFDEAHKATGNHAYCQVLRLLTGPPHVHRQFRILALSATPAADIQGVQSLIANLLISHLEMRTETSVDVKCFTQTRDLETIVVPLGPELRQFQNLLFVCIRTLVERLRMRNAFTSSHGDLRPERLAKYTVVKAREEWSSSPRASSLSPVDASAVQCNFGTLICVLHAMELLEQHGLRPLYQYLSGVLNGQRAIPSVRTEMMRLPGVSQLWSDLVGRFGDGFGNITSTQAPFTGGHPKLEKLRELLCEHFRGKSATDTRVIVFSQLRDSVEEIMHMLKQLRPLIRPACFMGQSSAAARPLTIPASYGTHGDASRSSPAAAALTTRLSICASGVSQREQLRVMNAFREGTFNTLVSTCVGEEGLDVGQVDLIVCFDASKSPIRLAQRLGRTGRRRYGRIVMLLTEGREERNYQVSIARTTSIHKALLEGGAYKRLAFYPHNPRMVPIGLDPEVVFQNLKSVRSESNGNSIARLNRESSTKHKSALSSRTKTATSRMVGFVRSHIEVIDVENLNLNLTPVGPGWFHSLNEPFASVALPCFTDLFKVNTSDRLRSTRERLQAHKFDGSDAYGPATSTLHFVSILRLCGLQRCGLARLSFHALGLRSVDVETPFSLLVSESDYVSQGTQEAYAPPANHKDEESSEAAASYIPEVDITASASPRSVTVPKTFAFPHVIRGLVSKQLFFNPNADLASIEEMRNVALHFHSTSKNANDRTDITVLREAWSQHCMDAVEQCSSSARVPPRSYSSSAERITSFGKLEQWVDSSLLKAIAGSSPEGQEIQPQASLRSPIKFVTESCSLSSLPVTTTKSPPCQRSPVAVVSSVEISARSTPYVRTPNHKTNELQLVCRTDRNDHSQIRLEEALALLDRSTIRLEASALLLDDHLTEAALNSTALKSAVFTGPSNRLHFDTKLSLGGDFGDDLLLSSQAVGQSDDQPNPARSSQSTEHSSAFEFSSQIDWSPITLEGITSRIERDADSDELAPACQPVVVEELDSPLAPLRRRAGRIKRGRLLFQTQPNTIDFERDLHGSNHQFLLTQAEQSDDDISERDSENLALDGYESSFIDDDQSSQIDASANPQAPGCLDASDMLAVYLQTARSPPFGAAGQIPLRDLLLNRKYGVKRPSLFSGPKCQTTKKEGAETDGTNLDNNHLPYSQTPEDDEYALDSFCVNSADSTSVASEEDSPLQKRSKRRRLLMTCK